MSVLNTVSAKSLVTNRDVLTKFMSFITKEGASEFNIAFGGIYRFAPALLNTVMIYESVLRFFEPSFLLRNRE
jgi:hypothetical protein